ncbi:MAG: AsmA-like C-terminal region-containing protein [Gemmataceae bacterium]
MSWQKWLIRGLVLSVLGAFAAGGTLYALWTSPQAIRQLVQEKLGVRFLNVGVQVGSARLRLLGGILVHELRLDRSNSIDRRDFLYVPSCVIYHDKEQMVDGKVAIRRVELQQPQLRIVRLRDGRINVAGILGPVDINERMPTTVIRGGSLLFEDESLSSVPILEIHDLQLTMVNDPLPTLQFEGSGRCKLLGPIRFRASVPRVSLAATVDLELPGITIDGDFVQRLREIAPEVGQHLTGFSATGSVQARLQVPEDPAARISHDVSVQLRHGRLAHPQLPRNLDTFEFTGRVVDGVVPEAKLSAGSGVTRLTARVTDVRIPERKPTTVEQLEGLCRTLDLSVDQLKVDDDLLARLPGDLHFIKDDFSPAGPVSAQFRYHRAEENKPLVKEWTFEPQGMTGTFVDFPVPLREVRGTIWLDTSRVPRRNIRIELNGLACDRSATLRGTIQGEKKTSEIRLDIAGKNLQMDDRVYRALPPRAARVARQFMPAASRKHGLTAYPMGEGDVEATIRRDHGQTRVLKTFTLHFRNTSVLYDQFPYPLENVSGVLVLHPDHWEAHGFRGSHAGGEMFVDGRSTPLPVRHTLPVTEGSDPSSPERVHIRIRGKDILLDSEFERALVPASGSDRQDLQTAWRRLRMTGRLSFAAEVVDHPGQPQDIDVSVNVQGCSMRPGFFDYSMEDLSGLVRYTRNRLYLTDMKARHGRANLHLGSGLIQLGQDGGFTAWLQGLTGKGITMDASLMHAVPESLRRVFEPLRLKTPVDIAAALTLVAPPGPSRPMEVWWEGALRLEGTSFRTGVEVNDATGQVFCKGYHDGRRLRHAAGNLRLERASILGQPMENLMARLEVEPATPDTVRVRDLRADLFGGTLAGQARLDTAPTLRYDVLLEAIGVKMEQLGRHNLGPASGQGQMQMQGPARAALHITGEGTDLLNLKGNGRIDVAQGKLGPQLPVLFDLVKAFGLRVPDRTMFEQAHLVFAIEGPQIQVQQADLYGNAFSVRGQGSMDLDGSNLNLDFSATPGRMTQILPAGLDVIPQAISGQILKIKMRGKLGKGNQIKLDKELIPAVTEPLRRVMGTGS